MEKMSESELTALMVRLKRRYREEKAKLPWAQDDVEEGDILETMETLKKKIKAIAKELERRHDSE
ncbi:hypothetical protein [Hydrogenimonas sp. SS33]|uniref:hypothetical protein n=1 Tax=Hydrogenimonas leucolamina TaxID=2954236 RepID=UPI00336C0221